MTDPKSRPQPSSEELAAKTATEMALEANELLGARPGADKSGDIISIDKASLEKASKAAKAAGARPQIDSVRETVESIAVAFILAFLFRTFVAEAFVIPTGSMATTLMGRHKDIECPNCQYRFQAGASQETDRTTGDVISGVHVERAVCPNCGLPIDTRDPAAYPSYKGDRIIVSKLSSHEPKRWDVTVFRYPEEAGTNYIKRLVGLPGEAIKIQNGDLHARPMDDPGQAFRILRKPPDVVRAMLRDVYDNDHTPRWMTEAGWPPRWQPCPMNIVALTKSDWAAGQEDAKTWSWPPAAAPRAGQWTTDDYRSFVTDGSSGGDVWVRYQHFRPGEDTWFRSGEDARHDSLIYRAPADVVRALYLRAESPQERERIREAILESKPSDALRPVRYAISELSGYNESSVRGPVQHDQSAWASDLAVECEVSPQEWRGEVVLELIEGGEAKCGRVRYRNQVYDVVGQSPDGSQLELVASDDGTPIQANASACEWVERYDPERSPFPPLAIHRFQCRLDLSDRSIRLTVEGGNLAFEDGKGQPQAVADGPMAKDAIPAGKPFRVLFANVDSQLLVWINDDLVAFERSTAYSLPLRQPERLELPHERFSPDDRPATPDDAKPRKFLTQTTADYSPVGIASQGASVRVSHLRVLRDVYYHPNPERGNEARGDVYPLAKDPQDAGRDQFFTLGDNSPQSLDARAWKTQKYVERKLLIGKAIYIFWPHSWDSPVPFTPNWKRMQFIR
jgi:signal peptidase I